MTAQVEEAAAHLYTALTDARPVSAVREVLGADDVAAAYEAQEVVITRRIADGVTRIGRKVGLTNPAVQRQLRVDQPDFGVLLSDMEIPDGGTVDVSTLIAPRIEAEVAFILGSDVAGVDRDSVLASVVSVVASLEIVDSRVRDWDISIVDTIADNASSALFVIGADRVDPAAVIPREVTMSMTANGEVVSAGDGAACLGDPVDALVWVAETAARLGRPLRAGEVVLSGALGPMVPFTAGTTYVAEISGLGSVSVIAEGADE